MALAVSDLAAVGPEVPAGNPALIEKALVDMASEWHREWLKKAGSLRQRWERHLAEDRMEAGLPDSPGSDFSVPRLKKAYPTFCRGFRESLFPNSDWFEYSPKKPGAELAAHMQTLLVQDQLREGGLVPEMTERGFYDWVMQGWAVFRLTWEFRVGERKLSASQLLPETDEFGMQTGRLVEQVVEQRELVELISRPKIKTVNLFSLFLSHLDVESMEELDYVGETGVITLDQLAEDEERWESRFEWVEGNPIEIVSRVGKYRNLEKIRSMRPEDLRRLGSGSGQVDIRENLTGDDDKVSGFDHKIVTTRLNLMRVLYGNGATYGGAKFSQADIDAFLKKWDLEGRDVGPGGWWVMETVADKELVRLERNPYPFEDLNYRSIQFFPVRGQLPGHGIRDVGGKMEEAMVRMLAAVNDGATKITYPMYVVPSVGAVDTSFGSTEEQLEYSPGKPVMVQAVGIASKDVVSPLAPPENIVSIGLAVADRWDDRLGEITGAAQEPDPDVTKPRTSATAVQATQQEKIGFVTLQADRFEEQILEPFLDLIWPMNRRNIKFPQAIRVLGEDGAFFPFLVQPEWLEGDVTPHAKGTVELTQSMVMGQVIGNLFSQYAPTGWVNPPEWIKLSLRTMRIPGDQRKLVFTPQQMMLQAMGGAMGGGMQPPGQQAVLEGPRDMQQRAGMAGG